MRAVNISLGTNDEARRLSLLKSLAEEVGAVGQRGASVSQLIQALADAYEQEPETVTRYMTEVKRIRDGALIAEID